MGSGRLVTRDSLMSVSESWRVVAAGILDWCQSFDTYVKDERRTMIQDDEHLHERSHTRGLKTLTRPRWNSGEDFRR